MIKFLDQPWLLVAVSACCNCIGTILLKQSRLALNNSSSILVTIASPWFLTALIAYCTGLLLLTKSLDQLPVSIVVPTSQGIVFISITFISHWLFKESLTFKQVTAVSFILVGIIIMSRK
ncbi:SMR family transporter [Nostoc sp. UHCC 0302]|uniref:DMT family transporter n=1 Tax=Nostoc sp. UHCC 0302 TaxID=3134896 RepID=UPI00311CA8C4